MLKLQKHSHKSYRWGELCIYIDSNDSEDSGMILSQPRFCGSDLDENVQLDSAAIMYKMNERSESLCSLLNTLSTPVLLL